MTAPLFYVDEVRPGRIVITGEDARHAAGAMRLRVAEPVILCDGRGTVGQSVVAQLRGRDEVAVEVGEIHIHPEPREITVVQAIPKGERADLAVELLTETGASRIVPWTSQRTVADWRGKEQAKVQRWRRVATAAAKQSRRYFLPVIDEPRRGIPEVPGRIIVLHEQARTSLFDVDLATGPLTVVVGPEGGLSDAEVAGWSQRGAVPVRLGDQILRTSTAGSAACVWIRGIEKRGGA